jgi:hypothetical protein
VEFIVLLATVGFVDFELEDGWDEVLNVVVFETLLNEVEWVVVGAC